MASETKIGEATIKPFCWAVLPRKGTPWEFRFDAPRPEFYADVVPLYEMTGRAKPGYPERLIEELRKCEDIQAATIRQQARALEQIARMKLFPDDIANRTTLHAAIAIARRALSAPEKAGEVET